jgi:hypothetical protein
MIGGPPVSQGYPFNQYSTMPPQTARPGLLQRRPAATTGSARVGQSETAGGTGRVRAKADEEPTARPTLALEMPTPDQLGLGSRQRAAEVDWSAVRTRMESLAVVSFHLQKLTGGFRFTCVVPAAGSERRKIEADGLTEAEAIDLALTRAEARQ